MKIVLTLLLASSAYAGRPVEKNTDETDNLAWLSTYQIPTGYEFNKQQKMGVLIKLDKAGAPRPVMALAFMEYRALLKNPKANTPLLNRAQWFVPELD